MGFMAWMRKIQDGLHERAEAIRRAEESKRNQELSRNPPTEVRTIVSFSDKTVRDTKAENDRTHSTQESIKNAAWAAFIAATIYAFIASMQWCEMKKTTKAAQDQLAIMRDADRPWVSLDVLISSPLTFDAKNGLRVEFKFAPKNIGRSPAQNISIVPKLIPSSMGEDLREKQKNIVPLAPEAKM